MFFSLQFFVKKCFFVLVMVSTLLLCACANKSVPTVSQSKQLASQQAPESQQYCLPLPDYHTVQNGDSVSAIAKHYGLKWRDLSAINKLGENHTIYPNQRLRLSGNVPLLKSSVRKSTSTSKKATSKKTASKKTTSQSTKKSTKKPAKQTSKKTTGKSTKKTNKQKRKLDTSKLNKPTPRPKKPKVSKSKSGWFRPARGRIFAKYRPSAGIKGIRFEGKKGDPVFASKSGEVIYASDGLEEYGNLILIRHKGDYISAYAHVNKMLVKEGDRITTGKKIATIGSTGTNAKRNMLEFQIRKYGKPVDPLSIMNP